MGRRRTFGNVRTLPSGRYQARYLDPSGYRRRAPITFPTIADANVWLSTSETAIARGVWIDPRSSAITFESYADSWLESRPGLRPRTGELAALTRARIDLTARTIAVVENQIELSDGPLLIGPPKSDAGRRTIVIPNALVPELTAHLGTFVSQDAEARDTGP